jgi:glycosyltransferase involved in cell wall biosynthesis
VSAPVSVLVTARDEEAQLPGALASVAEWAAETLVVVDPRSTDRTAEIARAAGAAVLPHAYASSAAQCNWGLERCAHDWVFVLDADERATPALGDAIGRALVAPGHAAYEVRRTNLAFGRRLRFGDWGADRIVRLLDRRRARFEERAVHGAVLAPSVGRLEGTIEHHTLRSLPQYAAKLHDYARRGADDLLGDGRRATVVGAAARAEWRFVRAFVLRLGFLDGGAGFVVAVLGAYGTFLKWAAVWDATTRRRSLS